MEKIFETTFLKLYGDVVGNLLRFILRIFAIMVYLFQQESVNRVEYHAGAATEYIEGIDLSKVRKSRRRYLKVKQQHKYFNIRIQ